MAVRADRLQRVERERRMREGAARPHLGGDPDRFHDLGRRSAVAGRGLGVALDAIGALGHMGDRDSDELLGLTGNARAEKTRSLNFMNASCVSGASCLRLLARSGVVCGKM